MSVHIEDRYGGGMTRRADPLLMAFVLATLIHLAFNFTDTSPWDSISKCIMAPLLVAWVIRVNGPQLIAAALAFCFLGDLFLELDHDLFFLAGMAAFAIAHVCFIRFFLRFGAVERIKRNPLVVGILGMAAVAMIAWGWPGLPVELRVPVLGYAILLATTAVAALVSDRGAGIGALSFLASDTVIAMGVAERIEPGGWISKLAVMPVYLAAIFLLATSTVAMNQREANR